MTSLQSTITEMKSGEIISDLSDDKASPCDAFEWLMDQSDKITWGFRATLPGHLVSSGSAKFGSETVHFVCLHEDDFDPEESSIRTEATADNCTLCLKAIEGRNVTFVATQIIQALAE